MALSGVILKGGFMFPGGPLPEGMTSAEKTEGELDGYGSQGRGC